MRTIEDYNEDGFEPLLHSPRRLLSYAHLEDNLPMLTTNGIVCDRCASNEDTKIIVDLHNHYQTLCASCRRLYNNMGWVKDEEKANANS